MKLTSLLFESEYQQAFNKAVIDLIKSKETLDDLLTIGKSSYFSIDIPEYRHKSVSLSELLAIPSAAELIRKKLDTFVNDERSFIAFMESNFRFHETLDWVLEKNHDLVVKLISTKLTVKNNVVQIDGEKISNILMNKRMIEHLIKKEPRIIEDVITRQIEALPNTSISFDFSNGRKGAFFDGRGAIQISEKHFIQPLYNAIIFAKMFESETGDRQFVQLIANSAEYRFFCRKLSGAINRMLNITEADVYQEEFEMLLNRTGMGSFFDALYSFVSILEDAEEVGKRIFSWWYHLPRTGQLHKDKKNFLDVYSSCLENVSKFVKIESFLDSDESRLHNISYYFE